MAEKQILIICGEPSGELHAATLVSAIKKITPGIKIVGVGSRLLAASGAEIIYDTAGLSVMGIIDVLKKLPKFLSLKKFILNKITKDKFEAIIFVDFSGFNLRLAKAINNSIPTIYYVSPQVWASRPGRIETIKRYIKKMIVLFKFEKEFYSRHGMDADFAGHPLLDIAKPTMTKKEFLSGLGLSDNKKTIALFPGSRKQEIKTILPIMLETARVLKAKIEAQFIIAKPAQVDWDVYNCLIKRSNLEVKVVEGKTYDCMEAADFCLVCSGTATLETAIMQKPFVIIYKMNLLNYLLYRPQVKLPYIGMVNIVAGKKIIPEFVQFRARPKKIAAEVLRILSDQKELQKIASNLSSVRSSLGEPGAATRASQLILNFLT
ncbi:MAG: lipid-A-disaccharide synthase [Candidatus Omnitrophica bacterium]|nr:lipid-A-disaccharide synthase [Candidatus Omnitrophota bacterium]